MMPRPSPSYVRECISYDSKDGTFYWLERPETHFKSPAAAKRWNSIWARKRCGSVVMGRWVVCINARKYPASHIGWVLATGDWPIFVIDHINGDPKDNRLSNLRDVPEIENARNSRIYKTSTTGALGVYREKRWGGWYAQIGVEGRKVNLGSFATFEEAKQARLDAEKRYGFHENHGRAA